MKEKSDFSKVIDNIANTEIKKSPIDKYGLFSTKKMKIGEVLCILDGQYLKYDFVKKVKSIKGKCKNLDNSLKFLEWNQINNNLLLVRFYPTKYRYINHYRLPNCRVFQNPLRVVVIKEIKEDEELLLDYREEELGDEYLLDHGMTYL